jgi:DNA-binding transcriptional LysR family regulator
MTDEETPRSAAAARNPPQRTISAKISRWSSRLLPEWSAGRVDVHALYPSHRSLSAKVRVFIDALATHLSPVERHGRQ